MNKNPPPELRSTRDGSHTLFSHRFSQHYHNPNGAVAESRYIFFEQSGLLDALKSNRRLEILEVGFGTGLNLLLLLDYYEQLGSNARITFHSVEAYPPKPEIAGRFNYGTYISNPRFAETVATLFGKLDPGENIFEVHPGVEAHIFRGLFEEWYPEGLSASFIFHDAFSPDVNGELWTGETFEKLRELSSGDALLTTYCAASAARGAMAWAGWKVARAPGALGKREMTVASPDPQKLTHLERINEERLAGRYRKGDF